MNFDAKIRNISERIKQDNDYVASNKEFAADSHPFAMNKMMSSLKVGSVKVGAINKPHLNRSNAALSFRKTNDTPHPCKHESIKRLQVKTKKLLELHSPRSKTNIINY